MKIIPPTQWRAQPMLRLLKQIKGKTVLVIGDVGVDRYTHGAVERISPEAPVPIVRVEHEAHKLGLAANVADNIRVLGGTPLLTGVLGKDRHAEDFRALLDDADISHKHLIVDPSRRTVLKERIVSDRQQLLRVDYESFHPIRKQTADRLSKKIKSLISKSDVVVIEDYAKGMLNPRILKSIISEAKRKKKPVLVDPHLKTPLAAYRGTTILTPNQKETEILTGIQIKTDASLIKAGKKILDETDAQFLITTLGKDGMAIFSAASQKVVRIPTSAKEVFDVSGAGDTVIGVLSLCLAAEAPLEDAAILSNIAAGIEVGKRGTATVTPKEIKAEIERL